MKKLLIVFAHPDDESFVVGGTVAKYAALGWRIELMCATTGQAGNRGNFDQSADLSLIRTKELEQAAEVLGIHEIIWLPFMDGKLKDIPPGELEDIIYQEMREREPDIVITFESRGISNHPDHVKISLSTTYAFQKYAKYFIKGEKLGRRDPRNKIVKKLGGYTDRDEPRLYYACMPQEVATFLKKNEVIPDESFGKPWEGVEDKKVTTVIDISEYTEKKVAALAKHKSQIIDVERFLSIDSQPLAYQEYYILRMLGEEEFFLGKGDTVSNDL